MTTKTVSFVAALLLLTTFTCAQDCEVMISDWFDNGSISQDGPNDINGGFTMFYNQFGPGTATEPTGFSFAEVSTPPRNNATVHIVSNYGPIAPSGTEKIKGLWYVGDFTSNPFAINRMEFTLQDGFDFRQDSIAQPVFTMQIQEDPGTGIFSPYIRFEDLSGFGTLASGPMMDLAEYTAGFTVGMMLDANGIMYTITDEDDSPAAPIVVSHEFDGSESVDFSDFNDGGAIHIGGGIQSGANSPATITFENMELCACAVPEPNSMALFMLGLPMLFRRRR